MAFRPAHERPPRDLTERQKRFCQFYIVCWNVSEAARQAGYRHAEEGLALLKNPRVIARIKATQLAVLERVTVTKERVIEEFACLGFSNMADFLEVGPDGSPKFRDLTTLSRQRMAAVKRITIKRHEGRMKSAGKGLPRRVVPGAVEVKLELHAKDPSLLRLGQHLGLFPKDGAITPFEANGETKEDVAAELLSRFAGIARRLNLPVFAAPPDVIEIEADKPKDEET